MDYSVAMSIERIARRLKSDVKLARASDGHVDMTVFQDELHITYTLKSTEQGISTGLYSLLYEDNIYSVVGKGDTTDPNEAYNMLTECLAERHKKYD